MNPRRFATGAAVCGTIVLAGWVIAWLAGFGSAGIENTGAVPIEDRRAASLAADVEFANAPQTIAMSNAAVVKVDVAKADVAMAVESVTGTASDTTAVSDEPESIIWAALPNSPQVLPPQSPPVQMATASMPDPVPNDAKEATSSIEVLDECLVADTCNASNPAPVTRDFRYLIYYVWSELPPAEKPADIVLGHSRTPRSERRSRRSSALPTLSVWISIS